MSVAKPTNPRFIDLEGKRFGRLVVVEYAGKITSHKSNDSRWLCRCDCGTMKTVASSNLKRGNTVSCGCYQREYVGSQKRSLSHGLSRSREYNAWAAMLRRCENPKNVAYASYGGRGIRVCERYHRFADFFADMGFRPSPGLTVDRVDNDRNYSCGKCEECLKNGWKFNLRWATRREQSNNTRSIIRLTYNGKTQSLAAWARETGVNKDMLRGRYRLGWSAEEMLTNPSGHFRFRKK